MEIIAHRGASGYAPENTLIAFKKAIDMGAKAIEFDVQMTKDEEIVVIHDYTLDRTTTGTGFVMEKTADEIRDLDAGSWFGDAFIGEKVPLFEALLDLVHPEVVLNVEIKKVAFDQREVEKKVLEIIMKKNRLENTVFSSFDHRCLKNLLEIKKVQVGMLISCNMIDPIGYATLHGIKSYSINQNAAFVNEEFIKEVHKKGLKVLSYTINDRATAEKFKSLGVDGIFSNYPDIMDI
ncbi:glycerophosphodiester phosphodiesterase [Petrocella sp. FN5]|uniref:glycerophosphodiester phosphodiesterase n=1 Tax=Petrocella sp. FN5 TaxID=3032002 RepID=UPI0023DAC8E0|nr:glycerophosphodiester phosphodiesterase family protein [Petrocella sp. FN5]MDF1616778.1 glycerophosphodiester phosphodiesterase family protein [Petrocella sp. FN5]